VRQPGFDYRLVSVIVPPDSGQRIRVTLPPLTRKPTHREAYNVEDFGERLAWRDRAHSRVYTRAEMKQMGIEWVYDAVSIGFQEIHSGREGRIDKDCDVVKNGGPETVTLANLTVDDVETVEIYDGSSAPRPLSQSGRPVPARPGAPSPRPRLAIEPVPLSNTDLMGWRNKTKACTIVYVWLR
jgi:hypothetical protein